jgi:outer membrane receptor protein involved in Fe transport
MKLKSLIFLLPLLCLLAGQVMGSTTGKITGLISDTQTKEPLVGVSVLIMGTSMGAQTDAEGRYTILNIPVGTYKLKISTIGYAPLEVDNVEVSADLATYQSHSLTSQVTDLNKTITVTAERPLVIKDQTTSINIVKREDILAMPTRGFEQVVGIQNSIVRLKSNVDVRQRGLREAVGGTSSEINLRGGRPSEVAYYVDGFSQQDPLSGISTANINNNAIKEISVVAGAFSAEYGNVASGIVNVVTNSGTDKYKGNLEVVSDNLMGSTHSYDQNYYSGDFGGPIPGLEKGYFFFSGERRWLGDRDPSSRTKELFDEYGAVAQIGENTQRLPNNTLSGWSWQGKLDYNFSPNVKLALSSNGSLDNWQEYRHSLLFDRAHNPRYRDFNVGHNIKLTHTLNANTFYNLSASYFKTYRFRGDGVAFDDIRGYDLRRTNIEEDAQNLFFQDGYYWGNYLKRNSIYYGAKGDITSRITEHHTLRAGFDIQRHTLRYYENLDATQFWSDATAGVFDTAQVSQNLNRYGYDMYGGDQFRRLQK